jgi:hypothetical protein
MKAHPPRRVGFLRFWRGRMKSRLPARVFYGVIVAGVLLGVAACAAAGWVYLHFGDHRPTGRQIWDADAGDFVIPVCVMIGATYGGLMGVAAAVILDRSTRD